LIGVQVLLNEDYNTAQDLFMRSTNPLAALEMRKDLKHWDEALKLAQQLDPEHIAPVGKEYAQVRCGVTKPAVSVLP
jgi:WD repeat-containing protein 19